MPVYLETFPFPVLIQDIFRTVVDRILEHLYRRWIEGGVYTAPFTDAVSTSGIEASRLSSASI